MPLGVMRTKSLDAILKDAETPEMSLNRTLGATDIIMLGIGAIIGAGIFSTVGTAAAGDASRPGAGAALMVSFIITAVVCGFTALCYAEFASMVPISGSAYTYAYATLGEVVAWIIGWDLIIEYAVGNVGVAISWAAYFRSLLDLGGIHVPDWLAMDYRTYLTQLDAGKISDAAPLLFGKPFVFNIMAAVIVFAITVLLVWGVRESAKFNTVMVIFKLIILAFFVIVGATYINSANYTPFAPTGFAGISTAAAVVFFAYIGFDAVSTVAEETREPQRNMPIGIIGSLIVCTIIYVVVAAVFTGLISYDALQQTSVAQQAEPLTYALKYAAGPAGETSIWLKISTFIVAVGAVIATTAVLLVFQMGQPRIFFSMARDGLLPTLFAKIHPKWKTPHVTTILTGLVVGVIGGVTSIDEMVNLTNIGTLFAFILVCAGVIILRYRDPDRPRPFRVPGGIVIPVCGILSCLYLMYFLPSESWFRFAAWLNFGFIIYIAYGAVRSRLTGRDTAPDAVEHNADTAWAGAALGALGLVILFGTLAFDMQVRANTASRNAREAIEGKDDAFAKTQKALDEARGKTTEAEGAGDAGAVAATKAAQASALRDKAGLSAGLAGAYLQHVTDGQPQAREEAGRALAAADDAKRAADEVAAMAASIQGGDLVAVRAATEAYKAAADAYDDVANAYIDAAEAQRLADQGPKADPRVEIVPPAAQAAAAAASAAADRAAEVYKPVPAMTINPEDKDARDNAQAAREASSLAHATASRAKGAVTSGRDLPESVSNPSWFLIVPLLFNILVLFPVVINRSRKVLAAGGSAQARSRATMSIAIAAVLLVAGVGYLVWTAPQKVSPAKTIHTTAMAQR